MTSKVIVLQVGAGIQRDGTQFASGTYVDGKWVRFQYGKPRKIAGYNGAFLNAAGISRGMIMNNSSTSAFLILTQPLLTILPIPDVLSDSILIK